MAFFGAQFSVMNDVFREYNVIATTDISILPYGCFVPKAYEVYWNWEERSGSRKVDHIYQSLVLYFVYLNDESLVSTRRWREHQRKPHRSYQVTPSSMQSLAVLRACLDPL